MKDAVMTSAEAAANKNVRAPLPKAGILKIGDHMLALPDGDGSKPKIDISSNESAFGPSPLARAAARRAGDTLERYCSDGPERLARAIGQAFDLDPSRIVCGTGSDDLLARLARAYLAPGDQLVHSRHGYQKFPNYAFANDAVPVAASDQNFRADIGALSNAVTDTTRMVMIANPDNPTGTHLSGDEIRELHHGLPDHVLLVLDSAYGEYVDAPDFDDPVPLIDGNENVVMTRTFSKIFGLAGLRIGWMYGPPRVVDVVKRIGLTFPLSNVAVDAAMAALSDDEHQSFVRRETARIKADFSDHLTRLGSVVYPSQTNFVLADFAAAPLSATTLDEKLQARGIFVRRMTSPAFADCIRFTIGTADEMNQVAQALDDLLRA